MSGSELSISFVAGKTANIAVKIQKIQTRLNLKEDPFIQSQILQTDDANRSVMYSQQGTQKFSA
jgi:hypothetical protein